MFLLTNRAIFANDLFQNAWKKHFSRSKGPRYRYVIKWGHGNSSCYANRRTQSYSVQINSKFLQTGSVKNRPKSGRPRSTSAVQDRFLRLTALRQRFKSSVNLTANHRRATGVAIHPRTARNRLKSAGIKPRRPCLRNKLTPHHKRERLAWCRHRRCWRRNQWGNILWSDESLLRPA